MFHAKKWIAAFALGSTMSLGLLIPGAFAQSTHQTTASTVAHTTGAQVASWGGWGWGGGGWGWGGCGCWDWCGGW